MNPGLLHDISCMSPYSAFADLQGLCDSTVRTAAGHAPQDFLFLRCQQILRLQMFFDGYGHFLRKDSEASGAEEPHVIATSRSIAAD